MVEAVALERRDADHAGPAQKVKFTLEVQIEPLAFIAVEQIPLIDRHHKRAPGVEHVAGDVGITFTHAFLGVNDKNDNVGVLNGLQRFNDGKLLHGLKNTAFLSQTSRIHQLVGASVIFEIDLDRIARCARHIKSNDALFADQCIDEGGFAGIRTAGKRDLDAAGTVIVFFGFRFVKRKVFRQARKRQIERIADTLTMRAGNQMRFTEPEFIELRLGGFRETFGFIDKQHDRSISAAQMLRDADILRRQTGTGVGQEKNNVGLLNRKLGLPGHGLHNPFGAHRLKAARIHHDVGTGTDASLTVLAISGETRKICHDGISAAGEPIEKRRLADIRPAHESDDWKHVRKTRNSTAARRTHDHHESQLRGA